MTYMKKCPFCGGEPLANQQWVRKYGCYYITVQCETCRASTRGVRSEKAPSEQEWETREVETAISLWNRRTNDN